MGASERLPQWPPQLILHVIPRLDGDHVTTTCRERVCYERTNERTNERVFFFIYFFMLLKHARAARRDRALPLHVVVVAARSAHAKFVFPIPSAA